MKRATRTLAIVALTTLVSCSGQFTPASPPAQDELVLGIYSTYATEPLMESMSRSYTDSHPNTIISTMAGNHKFMLERLYRGEMRYFISQHLDSSGDSAGLWAAPVAQDGLVLLLHPDNSISNLSASEIRNIYQGFIRNWQETDGQDLDIILISRENGSGTRNEFERLVMGQRRTSPNAQIVSSNEAMITAILKEPGAIGYTMLSQSTNQLQILAIDGMIPSITTITNSTYPLRSTIYIIGLNEPIRSYRTFIGWVQSSAGQNTIASQYAPIP